MKHYVPEANPMRAQYGARASYQASTSPGLRATAWPPSRSTGPSARTR
jgi:hypothetical protein